jgi:hypothetical protein
MLDRALEHGTGCSETVAGTEQAINFRSVTRPLLDLIEVPVVSVCWTICLLMDGDVIGFRLGHGKSIAQPYWGAAAAPFRHPPRLAAGSLMHRSGSARILSRHADDLRRRS